jgi:peptidoglycan/xylan/chitin deacetylase (PgdA/CDA1 family)
MRTETGTTGRRPGRASARSLLARGVKGLAAGVDALRRPGAGIVVLAYHRVGGHSDAAEIDLPSSLFRAQMAAIAPRAITLDTALDALADRISRPHGDVVVTFDDGTVDFVDDALPVLVEYRVPAVVYVETAFVDEGRPFPHGGRPVNWSALRDAVATGLVTVGSHTHTHALLDRSPAPVVADELDRSIALIADNLGAAPAHFAYPKALRARGSAAAAVAGRFRSAAVAGTRANPFGATDPQLLARSPVQRSDGMRWFDHKVAGGMALEDGLRRAANRFRYAGAST